MNLDFSQHILEKYSNNKFHETPSSGGKLFHAGGRTDGRTDRRTDRQTDMANLIVAFRSFSNVQ
jgi:hypothetical protein